MRKMITEAIIYPMTGALLVMEWTIDRFSCHRSKRVRSFGLNDELRAKVRAVLRSRRQSRRY